MGETKFNIGDIVVWTNDYGVNWGDHEIVGTEPDRGNGYFYIAPSLTPWCAIHERGFTLAPAERQNRIAPPELAGDVAKAKDSGKEKMIGAYARHKMLKENPCQSLG